MAGDPTKTDEFFTILKSLEKRVSDLERAQSREIVLREGERLVLSPEGGESWIVFNSALNRIEVYVNGALVATHP